MKTLLIAATVLAVLLVLASVGMAILSIWSGDGRWFSTGLIMFFVGIFGGIVTIGALDYVDD